MRYASGLAAIVVLASVACGSEAQVHTNKYVTKLALNQVAADLGPGAVVVGAVDTATDDQGCEVNEFTFSNCTISSDQPPELHVQTTLCELKPDQPTETRFFVECRPVSDGILPPELIPHCPGHGSYGMGG